MVREIKIFSELIACIGDLCKYAYIQFKMRDYTGRKFVGFCKVRMSNNYLKYKVKTTKIPDTEY